MTEPFLTEHDVSMGEPITVVHSIRRGDIGLYDRGMDEDPTLRAQEDRLSQVCFEDDDGYTVIDVWRSEAAFERFEGARSFGPLTAMLRHGFDYLGAANEVVACIPMIETQQGSGPPSGEPHTTSS